MFKPIESSPLQLLRILILLPLLLFGQTATALVIQADYTGWYRADGFHDPANVNFITGMALDAGTAEFRNFFVFDLSGVDAISNATLRAYLRPDIPPFHFRGYQSPDATEIWGLFDVTTSLVNLLGGIGGVSAFADLGSGIAYGQAIVSADDMGSFVEVSLNAAALASIGAADNLWAVGGKLLTLGPADPEVIFAWSHEDPRVELVLTPTVPAPATAYLFALALVTLYRSRRGRPFDAA